MSARTTIGAAKASAVLDSEGAFFLPLSEAFPSLCEDVQEGIGLSGHDPTSPASETWWLSFRVYVVEVGDRVILVDTGAASDTALRAFWAPTGPHLTQRLFDELGLPAELVTDVVLTHLHRDHAAGSIDASGAPAFRQARYHLQAAELQVVNDRDPAGLWLPLLEPLRS